MMMPNPRLAGILKACLVASALVFFPLSATAAAKHGAAHSSAPVPESEQLKAIVGNLLHDNDEFVKSRGDAYFKPFFSGQTPRATVVTCSDSRVHTHALDKTPDGDLFMVRNIGNQLATAEGSIEYGVHHLHTPLLIFVGHSSCGAIKAASGDYRKESAAIKRELKSINIPKGIPSMEGVRMNVNKQVATALKKFGHEVKDGNLTVLGAVYDFTNELGQGYGRLNVINLNGETDVTKIRGSKLLAVPTTQSSEGGKFSATEKGAGNETNAGKPATAGVQPPAYSYP